MRDVGQRNSSSARQLGDWAATSQYPLHVVELDVTEDASVQSAVDKVMAAEGQIDVVVNNAGTGAAGPLESFSIAQMSSLIDINVLGPMRVNQAVLPTMRARHSGLIIWITSGVGRVLPNFGGLYAATKWAAEDSPNPSTMTFDDSGWTSQSRSCPIAKPSRATISRLGQRDRHRRWTVPINCRIRN